MSYANYYKDSGMYHVSVPRLMGTRLDALLFGNDESQLAELWNDAEIEMRRLEKMLNRFDRESEVSRINDEAQFTSAQVSDEFWQILLDCRKYYERTEHCFDITLKDFRMIDMNETAHSVRFESTGMMLDFGGFAKGYALRGVRQRFIGAGLERALVNFGNSSVLAIGTHPQGDSWSVGIVDPFSGETRKNLQLRDTAMSVSGNTPDNMRHIVTPQTSMPAEERKMAVVVADDPLDAEVLTTAWIASGQSEVPLWMSNFEVKNTYMIQ